jgi:cytochrome c2
VYSKALTASGIIWTEETLDSYIESPARFIQVAVWGLSALQMRANAR